MIEREYDFFVETTSGERYGVCLDHDGTAAIYGPHGDLIAVRHDVSRDDLRSFGKIVGGSQLTRARVELLP
jgi:hypothetical protein